MGHGVATSELRGGQNIVAALAQARAELRAVRATAPHGREESIRGEGTAANGLVRVAAEGGRIVGVDLDQQALRLAPERLASAIASAANDALAGSSPATAAGATHMVPDLVALEARLAEMQDDGVRQLVRYAESISESIKRVGRGST
jgi:DNA-binding protein YbaB